MLKCPAPTVGSDFPLDEAVQSQHGSVALSEMFATGPIVVAFHRLDCPVSQRSAEELALAEYQFDAAGTRVVIVYREDLADVMAARAERRIPFDCVSDPHGALASAALDDSDVTTLVVDRDARVVYAHRGDCAAGTAPVDVVLSAVRRAAYGRTAR